MNIIGPETLVFGVDDVNACTRFVKDYGLEPAGNNRFEALDGTGLLILAKDDPALPPGLATGTSLRKTIHGVADQETLELIASELGKDREVKQLDDGSIEANDDLGFVLGFQISKRKPLSLPCESVNAPGAPVQRPVNVIGAHKKAEPKPRTLSHLVYFVPDSVKAEAFYSERLGFVTTDRFTGVGPFMRPAATNDHHTVFFIQTPPQVQGIEHFTFHMGGPTELMHAGTNMVNKGYQSFWGPGRHLFGSNWFWYFKSPFGCNMEFDADMDLHDDDWSAREAPLEADNSQVFLLEYREKWVPMGPQPGDK